MKTQRSIRLLKALRRYFFAAFGLLLIPTTQLSAQSIDWDANVPASWLKGATLSVESPQTVGTPYLFDEWLAGSLMMRNGRLVEGVRINFVNQEGELMVSKPYAGLEVKYGVVEMDVTSVTVAAAYKQRKMHFVRMWSDTIEEKGTGMHYFYEVMVEGNMSLLRKPYKSFVRGKAARGYSNGETPAKYVLSNDYYLQLPGSNEYITFKLSRQTLLKALGKTYGNQAKALMKQNKWKWHREVDIMLMIKKLSQ